MVRAGHAGGIGGAEDGADRGPRDLDRADAEPVKRFENDDMGKAARAARAQHEADPGMRRGFLFHPRFLT